MRRFRFVTSQMIGNPLAGQSDTDYLRRSSFTPGEYDFHNEIRQLKLSLLRLHTLSCLGSMGGYSTHRTLFI